MRAFLKSAFAFCGGMMLALAGGEWFIRLLSPQRLDNNLDCFEPDSVLVFSMKKGYRTIHSSFEFSVPVAISSFGIRDKEITPKHESTFRVIGLGDSFTFGNGVKLEETFLKQLESCLKPTVPSVEVINCGIPAYSPLQELRFLERYRASLEPDVVILGFFVGNDFIESGDLYDSAGTPTLRVVDGNLVSTRAAEREHSMIRLISQPLRYYLSTHSHLYVFLRDRGSQLLSRFGLRPFNLPPDFCKKTYSERMEAAWRYTQAIIEATARNTAEHREKLIVVILPVSYQVYQHTWNEYIAALKLDPSEYDLDKPQRLLAQFLDERGIEYVDPLPALRQNIIGPPLFYSVDGHLTAEGHRIVSRVICEKFRNASWQGNGQQLRGVPEMTSGENRTESPPLR